LELQKPVDRRFKSDRPHTKSDSSPGDVGSGSNAAIRFVAWIAVAAGLSVVNAPTFLTQLNQSLGDTFGSVFPAIPFAALLTLIFALRWRDLAEILNAEGSVRSLVSTRVVGIAMVASLVVLEPFTSQTVETSGLAVVLTFYGVSLAINPLTRRFILPYAGIYAAGLVVPFALQWALGEPLAALSADFSGALVGLLGFPVAWQGTQFQFLSKSGEVISGVVTPGCSSIISVTTFLGLLALMHMDLKKDVRSTAILAVVGIGVLTVLNSVRIMLLMWVGFDYGLDAYLGIHNWVGYAIFLGFYLAALPVYSRMGRQGRPAAEGLGLNPDG
jgi:exosortase/archaeosortase family protein